MIHDIWANSVPSKGTEGNRRDSKLYNELFQWTDTRYNKNHITSFSYSSWNHKARVQIGTLSNTTLHKCTNRLSKYNLNTIDLNHNWLQIISQS